MNFEDLALSPAIIQALLNKGYQKPTPIQARAIPAILEGRDLLAAAQTGTGKTASFTLPLLEKLSRKPLSGKPQVLILTPTRELAAQVYDNIKEYSTNLPLRTVVLFGGVNMNPQINALAQGCDLLVATPGRLIDLQFQGFVDLSEVHTLVLDEADRMLDMGFIRDIKRILHLLPEQRQTLLFSATFTKEVKKLTVGLLHNPVTIEIAAENSTVDRIDQLVYRVDRERKTELLIHLIQQGEWEQVLVFTRTKYGADRLARKLDKAGIAAAAIHGDKSQNQRTKALANFKANTLRALVATDIAARGIDIHLLPHVVNFELPNSEEDYVHRIGRTGRAGSEGVAISLVDYEEEERLRAIQKLIGKAINSDVVPGFEPDLLQAALTKAQKETQPTTKGNKKPRGKVWGKRPKRR